MRRGKLKSSWPKRKTSNNPIDWFQILDLVVKDVAALRANSVPRRPRNTKGYFDIFKSFKVFKFSAVRNMAIPPRIPALLDTPKLETRGYIKRPCDGDRHVENAAKLFRGADATAR